MRKDNSEPLLVQIPETGQYIDVRPFIHFFTREDSTSLDQASRVTIDSVEEHVRLLTMRVQYLDDADIPGDTIDMVNLFTTLHSLKDLAKNTTLLNSNKRREK